MFRFNIDNIYLCMDFLQIDNIYGTPHIFKCFEVPSIERSGELLALPGW
jgi:hypothetical protein